MTRPSAVVLIAVTARGLQQARQLRARLKTGEIHRPDRLGPAASGWEHSFTEPLASRVPDWFARCDQLVFFLATGAVTRLIAPCLQSKASDPGVLAIDEAGRFVVPMLSGHEGGANAFARTVAGCLGAVAVVTTASDAVSGWSLDDLETNFGWTLDPRERLKPIAMALVEGSPVALIQEIGTRGEWLAEQELPKSLLPAREVSALSQPTFDRALWITDRQVEAPPNFVEERILWCRPKSLVLGVGCERGITLAALEDGLERFLNEHRFARASIQTLASIDLKADEAALLELARIHDWKTAFYSAEQLGAVAAAPNPSEVVAQCVGTPGVAEPAALLASGADRLLVEKQILTSPLAAQRMTFALARRAEYQTAATRTGTVVFIGAGPGDPDLLTVKARNLLGQADVVVYAGSLVPEAILQHVPTSARLVNSAHLTLEQVMDCLIASARAGQRVVRLQSGDTSIYSAIQEQMTLLDDAGLNYEVVPGVSAFQAAAAVLKAELTLPEVVQTIILTRAEGETKMPSGEALADLARHGATLCIFLSARLCDAVQADLLTAYPPDTPTAILYRVSWPDEQIVQTTLQQLSAEMKKHRFTRTTLILVGAAVGGRRNRSRLYDKMHGHLFRAPTREDGPAAERHA